jgi:flagellar basal-body rod protein FlgC
MGPHISAADISASGLAAERVRMQVIANNIANAHTTRTDEGGPFRRQQVMFAPQVNQLLSGTSQSDGAGVRVVGMQADMSELPTMYEPGHPDANPEGFVELPNVSVATEMVDMMSASRSYEANLQALRSLRSMVERSLELLRNA